MTLKKVYKKYEGEYAILQPQLRDAATNRPRSFKVLKTCQDISAAEKAQRYYLSEGFPGVFIFPCFKEDTTLEAGHAANMFRILYGGER